MRRKDETLKKDSEIEETVLEFAEPYRDILLPDPNQGLENALGDYQAYGLPQTNPIPSFEDLEALWNPHFALPVRPKVSRTALKSPVL